MKKTEPARYLACRFLSIKELQRTSSIFLCTDALYRESLYPVLESFSARYGSDSMTLPHFLLVDSFTGSRLVSICVARQSLFALRNYLTAALLVYSESLVYSLELVLIIAS